MPIVSCLLVGYIYLSKLPAGGPDLEAFYLQPLTTPLKDANGPWYRQTFVGKERLQATGATATFNIPENMMRGVTGHQ